MAEGRGPRKTNNLLQRSLAEWYVLSEIKEAFDGLGSPGSAHIKVSWPG